MGEQLALSPVVERELDELVDGVLADTAITITPAPAASEMLWRNLYGEAQRIAERAASASTRRQYTAIFRAFCDWLTAQLHRPPLVGDLDADVIAAYGRHLAVGGGRGGRPAAPAVPSAECHRDIGGSARPRSPAR
ncbi:MAG: hypothetical protein ACLP8S_01385 [Solirubrobacteraceae bacterium]